ncbi:L-threonylcarbamoyladenylate synthase [Faecalicatena contorta]|uniref:L-threonylcarbamoyladenylate synthase n=1 Tax=Faecalicatena contorta TaxID=39482 RepID=UPI001F419593|nr:L-threonylcarbamoyladenylate synthase [Faecalicatena contorta]MCF2554677.1 threonylcarbamoyl-AMP synthase [Faecalicatena contorta]MCF2681129.1 threonylcarbamoyl-AMP synthase [Faecalicatena contorta]
MKTIIEKIDYTQLNSEENKAIIEKAGDILKNGGLVAFPTETVYGLGADALNEMAAHKIYEAKGRPSDNPLIVHITNMKDLEKVAEVIPEAAYTVAEKYWPGPLTMIFDKTDLVPYGTTGGLETVAVRMPNEPVARAVIDAGGGFIAAPSANTSGRPSPTTAQHVEEDLTGRIDMIIDGGAVPIGVESTILDMTVTPPMILRPGAITKEMLEELIGEVSVDRALISSESKEPPKAPGMKYRHYAPEAELSIVEGPMELVIEGINRMARERSAQGYRVGVIGTEETVARYRADSVKSVGTRTDESTIASHLYGILREFDNEKVDYIYSESFATGGIGSAIMNRLLKAAGHHVIEV